MRTLVEWLGHLLWRARAPGADPRGLRVWILVGEAAPPPGPEPDLALRAVDVDEAVALMAHLGRLGTVGRLVVAAGDSASPEALRRLRRAGREQRVWGMLSEVVDPDRQVDSRQSTVDS